MTVIPASVPGRATRRRVARPGALTGTSALGLGVAVLWFSLLVLIPLALVVTTALSDGLSGFLDTITNSQTLAAVKLTVAESVLVTLVNIVMGTVIA